MFDIAILVKQRIVRGFLAKFLILILFTAEKTTRFTQIVKKVAPDAEEMRTSL